MRHSKRHEALLTTAEKYPKITEVALNIAAANGAVNRVEGQDHVNKTLDYVLSADGVYEDDIQALEAWLLTLTKEQQDNLEDGEEDEVLTITGESPKSPHNDKPVANLFYDFWENL